MRSLAKAVLRDEMDYDGGFNPRQRIEPNVYEVGAPLSAWLHYHHEMAYVGRTTERSGSSATRRCPHGRGRTFVSDSIAATDALLATDFGQTPQGARPVLPPNLTDRTAFAGRVQNGVYNHWQQSFGTDDPAEAAARADGDRPRDRVGPRRSASHALPVAGVRVLLDPRPQRALQQRRRPPGCGSTPGRSCSTCPTPNDRSTSPTATVRRSPVTSCCSSSPCTTASARRSTGTSAMSS